jgi:hypothetical protein
MYGIDHAVDHRRTLHRHLQRLVKKALQEFLSLLLTGFVAQSDFNQFGA